MSKSWIPFYDLVIYNTCKYSKGNNYIGRKREKKEKKKKIKTEVNIYCGTVLFLHTHNAYTCNTMMAYVCPHMQDRLLLQHNYIYIRLLIINIKHNCIYIQHDINHVIT